MTKISPLFEEMVSAFLSTWDGSDKARRVIVRSGLEAALLKARVPAPTQSDAAECWNHFIDLLLEEQR